MSALQVLWDEGDNLHVYMALKAGTHSFRPTSLMWSCMPSLKRVSEARHTDAHGRLQMFWVAVITHQSHTVEEPSLHAILLMKLRDQRFSHCCHCKQLRCTKLKSHHAACRAMTS